MGVEERRDGVETGTRTDTAHPAELETQILVDEARVIDSGTSTGWGDERGFRRRALSHRSVRLLVRCSGISPSNCAPTKQLILERGVKPSERIHDWLSKVREEG
jgi:hypothetical protein